MEVLAPNGTKVKTSTAVGGFILAGPSNYIQFASTFTDPALTSVKVDVVLPDANKTLDLSNHVTGDAALNATGDLAATGGETLDTTTPPAQ